MAVVNMDIYIRQIREEYPHHVELNNPDNLNEAEVWCFQNYGGKDWNSITSFRSGTIIIFKNPDDALHFKMKGF